MTGRKRKLTVVGVGALGSHVVQFLRNENLDIKVIDFDRVERKNVLSQFHGTKSVGKSKVQGLQQSMQFMFARKIEGVPHRLREENRVELLGDVDLILDCLDNLEARTLVSEQARAESTPCLHGALAADGTFGRIIWNEYFVPDAEPEEGAATCEDGAHLPFIAIVASYLALAAQIYLTRETKVGYSISPGGVTRI